MRFISLPAILTGPGSALLLLLTLMVGVPGSAEPAATGTSAPQQTASTNTGPTAKAEPVAGARADAGFDTFYAPDFRLRPLDAAPIPPLAQPAHATKLADGIVDPVHGTRIYRATSAEDGNRERMRHEYSRRQAFNADNTRFIAMDGAGFWHLYDAQTFHHLRQLEGFAGDCEPLWDPRNPDLLYHTSNNGGPIWWAYDVRRGKRDLLFDFTGKTPWPGADAYWTKGEGSLSADGRTLALMATHYDNAAKRKTIYGLVTLDVPERRIVATLDATRFKQRYPDYVATSASGRYVVVGWGKEEGGTRAYARDFSGERQLHTTIEHSDVALGPNGEDFIVFANYDTGFIVARNIDTLEQFNIAPLYQGDKESYTVHISGQAFERPGWVVLSTYADSADYGRKQPSPTLRPQYRKVWLAELRPKGRQYGLAHVRGSEDWKDKNYFLEPQASVSRDLSRVIFASDFGRGTIEDYVIGLPSWAVPATTPEKSEAKSRR